MERSEEDAMSLLSYFQRSGIGAYLIVFRKDDSRVHSCQRSAKQFMVVAGVFMFLGRTVISFRHGNCFRGKTMLGNSPPPPPPPLPSHPNQDLCSLRLFLFIFTAAAKRSKDCSVLLQNSGTGDLHCGRVSCHLCQKAGAENPVYSN